jgi:hypothetical protein
MSSIPTLAPLPVAAVAAPDGFNTPVLDPEFEARWTKWVTRGRTHEGVARRKGVMLGGIVAVLAAVAYALTR